MEKSIKNAESAKVAETAKERNPSATYTIKSLGGIIKKLETLKMCKPEELKQLKEIHKTVVTRWIGGELGL